MLIFNLCNTYNHAITCTALEWWKHAWFCEQTAAYLMAPTYRSMKSRKQRLKHVIEIVGINWWAQIKELWLKIFNHSNTKRRYLIDNRIALHSIHTASSRSKRNPHFDVRAPALGSVIQCIILPLNLDMPESVTSTKNCNYIYICHIARLVLVLIRALLNALFLKIFKFIPLPDGIAGWNPDCKNKTRSYHQLWTPVTLNCTITTHLAEDSSPLKLIRATMQQVKWELMTLHMIFWVDKDTLCHPSSTGRFVSLWKHAEYLCNLQSLWRCTYLIVIMKTCCSYM